MEACITDPGEIAELVAGEQPGIGPFEDESMRDRIPNDERERRQAPCGADDADRDDGAIDTAEHHW